VYTIEEKAARYIAVKEINSLLCEHCLYFGRRQQDLELERLWCKDAKDPYFAQNNGRFVGYEALKNIYGPAETQRKARYDQLLAQLEPEFVGQPDELRYGTNTISLQTLSTPCIEIAEDMQTAKGLWTISAQVTTVDDHGPVGLWAYGKLAADLVREDGQWKIWHLLVCTDFVTPAGEEFDPVLGAKLYPAGLGIDETPTDPAELYSAYTDQRIPQAQIRTPEPYKTFAETFSY
jgi:hypothetical protein